MNEHDDRLTQRIRTSADDSSIQAPDPSKVIAAGRRRRRKDRLLASGAAIVIALGVTLPLRALLPFGEAADPPTVGTEPEPPFEVVIACDGGDVELSTSSVQPQADGVHMRVEYQGGTRAVVFWHNDDPPPTESSGFELDPDESTRIEPFPLEPGRFLVGCFRTGWGSMTLDPDSAELLDIVDPQKVWAPGELECPTDAIPFGSIGDELTEAAIREAFPGILPTDTVRILGYPESRRQHGWGVIRDGALIARFDFRDLSANDMGWTVMRGATCKGSGLDAHGIEGSDSDPGRFGTDASVLAEDVILATVTPHEDGTIALSVSFVVRWPDEVQGDAPPEQSCDVVLTRPDGRTVAVEQVDNTFEAADGEQIEDEATIVGTTSEEELPALLNDLNTWTLDVTCSPAGA